MDFFFTGATLPFTVALLVLTMLFLLEMGMGGGLTEALDTVVPDLEIGPDGEPASTGSVPSQVLAWLRVGKVPLLMLLAIFLGVFGAGGLLVQWLTLKVGVGPLPSLLLAPIMVFLSMPFVRVGGGLLGDLMPRDETQVLSQKALLGRVAVIVIGTARRDSAAQAKLRDEFGTTHYIMVEPVGDGDVLEQGDNVLVTSQQGTRYRAERVSPTPQQP